MSAPIKLNPPKDFDPYGGADKSYQPSAEVVDGQPVHWFSQCGRGPWGFGVYVLRQVGTRTAEYVRYKDGPVADVLDGRGDLDVGGDGKLYVNGSENDKDERATAFEVPGYVPFYNSAGQPVSFPAVVMIDLPDTTEMPNYGVDYKSDAEIMSSGLFYVRFNKLTNAVERDTAAIAQIQQVLKALGYLK